MSYHPLTPHFGALWGGGEMEDQKNEGEEMDDEKNGGVEMRGRRVRKTAQPPPLRVFLAHSPRSKDA